MRTRRAPTKAGGQWLANDGKALERHGYECHGERSSMRRRQHGTAPGMLRLSLAHRLDLQASRVEGVNGWRTRGLTFELSGRRRQDARARAEKMYTVPRTGPWWPAVGAPLERRVRPHCAICECEMGLPRPCYSWCLPAQASRSALATLVCRDLKPPLRPGRPRLTLLAAAAQQTD